MCDTATAINLVNDICMTRSIKFFYCSRTAESSFIKSLPFVVEVFGGSGELAAIPCLFGYFSSLLSVSSNFNVFYLNSSALSIVFKLNPSQLVQDELSVACL